MSTNERVLNFNGVSNATTPQLAKVLTVKMEKAERYLKAEIDQHGFLHIFYRTSTGFFVNAIYKQDGDHVTKHYFKNWNDTENVPFNPINFKD